MTSPLLLVLLLGAAQHTGQLSPTSDVSSNRVKATGASTSQALRDWAQTVTSTATDVRSLESELRRVAAVSGEPFPVFGAHQARALLVRAVMRCTKTFGSVTGPSAASNAYNYLVLRDYVHAVKPLPGYATKTELRAVVDAFMASIGTNGTFPYSPGDAINPNGSLNFVFPGTNYPASDSGPYLALLVALTHQRGDSTVYATHKTKIDAALAGPPRDAAGLFYSDPNDRRVGWGFEDGLPVNGGQGMVSALAAWAYQELALVANDTGNTSAAADYFARRDTLISGLRTLRRSDGFYKPSTLLDVPSAVLTSLIVAKRLCTDREANESGAALMAAYRAGTVTSRGGLRWLVYPNAYVAGGGSSYQDGGYWHGEWVGWLAHSMRRAGGEFEARSVLQEAVGEVLRQHRESGNGPYEFFAGNDASGAFHSGAAGGFLADVTEAVTEDLRFEIASGSTPLVPVPYGLAPSSIRVTAQAGSNAVVNVVAAASGSAVGVEADPVGAETTVFPSIPPVLGDITASTILTPAAVHGGFYRAEIASGTGPVSVRIKPGRSSQPPGMYAFSVGQVTGTSADNFATDSLAADYTTLVGTFAVSDGRLRNTTTADRQVTIFTGRTSENIRVAASCYSAAPLARQAGIALRVVDADNMVVITAAGSNIYVSELVGGVFTILRTIDVGATLGANAAIRLDAMVMGSTVIVTHKGTKYTADTTVSGTGGGGAYVAHASGVAEISWDELVVETLSAGVTQPVPPWHVLEYGSQTGLVSGEDYSAATGTVNLRDDTGRIVATYSGSSPFIVY